jgi:deoxyribonuclease-4
MSFFVLPSNHYIGMHVSRLSTFTDTFKSLLFREIETACQIFLRGNQRPFINIRNFFNNFDITMARNLLQKHNIHCVVHASYSYNLCSDNPRIIRGTIQGLVNELDFAVALSGNNYTIPVVIHTGSNRNKKEGINIATKVIEQLISVSGEITGLVSTSLNITESKVKQRRKICLENCAGEGNKIGSTIEELEKIYSLSEKARNQLFFCIDTAHLYGKGIYNFGDVVEIESFISRLTLIPPTKIAVIHLNDSIASRYSCMDRHALIGTGKMMEFQSKTTEMALKRTLDFASKYDITVILEPPIVGTPGLWWLWRLLQTQLSLDAC